MYVASSGFSLSAFERLADASLLGTEYEIRLRNHLMQKAIKLAPETIGLAATKSVTEIEVIDLAVKQAGTALRVRSSVMEMLNLHIPNPCIFRVTDEEDGPIETAIYPKVSGGVLYGDSAVFRYARRDLSMDGRAQDEWPSGVTTLESLLIHLAANRSE